MTPTRLALKEAVVERRFMTAEDFDSLELRLEEDQKLISAEVEKLFFLVAAEEKDGANLLISKVACLKEAVYLMHGSVEAINSVLTEYICSPNQKAILENYLNEFQEKIVWWVNNTK